MGFVGYSKVWVYFNVVGSNERVLNKGVMKFEVFKSFFNCSGDKDRIEIR